MANKESLIKEISLYNDIKAYVTNNIDNDSYKKIICECLENEIEFLKWKSSEIDLCGLDEI